MRRALYLFFVVLCIGMGLKTDWSVQNLPVLSATNCSIVPGSSAATITAAITAAKQGTCSGIASPITAQIPHGYNTFQSTTFAATNIVMLNAGSSTISQFIDVACLTGQQNILITGPLKSDETNLDIFPTTAINGPVANDFMMHVESCNQAGSVALLNVEMNGNRPNTCNSCVGPYTPSNPYDRTPGTPGNNNSNAPNGGGGAIQINSGGMSSPFYVAYDYLHGNQGGYNEGHNSALLFIPGSGPGTSGSYTSNVFYDWNQLGDPSNTSVLGSTTADCSNVLFSIYLNSPSGSHANEYGDVSPGTCSAAWIEGNVQNIHIDNNRVDNQEQAFKEIGGTFPNVYFAKSFYTMGNTMRRTHRNPIEYQGRGIDSVGFHLQYNDISFIAAPAGAGLIFSVPSCCGGTGNPGASITDVLDNIFAINDPFANASSQVVEWWSQGTASYNLIQGNPVSGINWGQTLAGQPYSTNYNLCQFTNSAACITPEDPGPPPHYSQIPPNPNVGNQTFSTLSTLTSAIPSISPVSQTISSPITVTVTDNGNGTNNTTAGPRHNTSIFCNLDGTAVTPSNTNWRGTDIATFTVNPGAIVVCVGMWGSRNQPKSWQTGFGYKPSNSVTNTYTNGGGTPTAATPVLSPATTTFTTSIVVNASDSTPGAVIHYTADGSTPTATSPVFHSGGLTITSTSTVQVLATATGYLTSGIDNEVYTLSAPANPTITGGFQGNVGPVNTLNVGQAAVQQTATGTYSDGVNRTEPDAYGNTPLWTSSDNTTLNVTTYVNPANPGGLISCLKAGTASSFVSAGGHGFSSWGWTCNPATATLTSISISTTSGITSLNTGSTNQLLVVNHFSDGSTTTTNPAFWNTFDNTKATISSSGLVTGVAAGSVSFTATTGSITSNTLPLTIVTVVSLQTITISNLPVITAAQVGWYLAWKALCNYSDGTSPDCTTIDSHGNQATWASQNTSFASFTNNILKVLTPGSSTVTASAAGVTSTPYNMTYIPAIPLTFTLLGLKITYSGTSITLSYK